MKRTTINIRNVFVIAGFTLVYAMAEIHAFRSVCAKPSSPQRPRSFALFGEKRSSPDNSSRNDQNEVQEFFFGAGDGIDCAQNVPSDNQVSNSLNRKIKELELGIGKRYIIRTQRGFLNVHHEPIDPFMSENVVNQLSDGQIVTATGPKRGIWVPHDGGGWSVSKYDGFTWLEPIDE